MGGPSFDLSQTDHLLTTTRAVRKRLDFNRVVEPEVLLTCIRIATQAPSGSNAQRWRWMVVTDPEKKKAVGHYYELSFEDYIAPKLGLIEPGDHASVRMTDSASFLAEHMAEVPVLVIPCVPRPAPGRYRGRAAGRLLGWHPSRRVELPVGAAQPRPRLGVDDAPLEL